MSFAALKARQKLEKSTHSDSVALRVHRAISWLGRSEVEAKDPDARFIFLWIAFNASYATELTSPEMTEKRSFQSFLRTLIQLDSQGRIGHLVWKEFPGSIRVLLTNPYVCADYWRHLNGELSTREWNARFKASKRAAELALAANNTLTVLGIVFSRLYVLRNQLIHGGATWNSQVNREQVRDCTNFLGKLVPVIIEIMMDHPQQDWGRASYPVSGSRSERKQRA